MQGSPAAPKRTLGGGGGGKRGTRKAKTGLKKGTAGSVWRKGRAAAAPVMDAPGGADMAAAAADEEQEEEKGGGGAGGEFPGLASARGLLAEGLGGARDDAAARMNEQLWEAGQARRASSSSSSSSSFTPTTESRNVLSSLLDRARACLPHLAGKRVETAVQYLTAAVKQLEASCAVGEGLGEEGREDDDDGNAAASRRKRSSSRGSIESFERLASATRTDNAMGSPLVSGGPRRVDAVALNSPNSAFIRQLPLAPVDRSVTSDFASPRMGARRLGGTPEQHGRRRVGGLQLSASRRGTSSRTQDPTMTPDPASEAAPRRKGSSPHTDPFHSRKLKKHSDTAGRLRQEAAAGTGGGGGGGGGTDGTGGGGTGDNDDEILRRKITVKGSGVTEDYASPRPGSRRLGTRKIRGGSGGGGEESISSRASTALRPDTFSTPVAEAEARAAKEARLHAAMGSPPASPRDVYSSVLLNSLAVNDMEENERQAQQDRRDRDRTPKPDYVRKLNVPGGAGQGENRWETPEQREILALLGRAEACCAHLSRMDPAVVQRVRVLLDLAAEQMEQQV